MFLYCSCYIIAIRDIAGRLAAEIGIEAFRGCLHYGSTVTRQVRLSIQDIFSELWYDVNTW